MHISEKIRLLREEKKLSQKELGEMIGGDARQISLYETQKTYPSSEAVSKLAKVLDVSADYLLFDEAERMPLILHMNDILENAQKISSLSEQDRLAVFQIINSLHIKSQFNKLANIQ
jgi:transcriptional regulator with XRE-family HTH domain